MVNSVVAIDVGSGTQDILLYDPEKEMENNIKMILPSQTQIISNKIERATEMGKDIFLCGNVMGGGASTKAVKKHLEKGLRVFSTKKAAYTMKDNLDRVRKYGVNITDQPPKEALKISLNDIDLLSLSKAFSCFDIELPVNFAIAVQDHGFSPVESNRRFRFKHWERFLEEGGDIKKLVYNKAAVPEYFSRMITIRDYLTEQGGEVFLMDTGAAAILGALEDTTVEKEYDKKGCLLLNVGNQHTIAFLLRDEKVYGVFEHHTGALSPKSLEYYLEKFRRCELTNEEVYNNKGHGCKILPGAREFNWDFSAVTGPRRNLARDVGYLAVPHGDMMLSGCFGLIRGIKMVEEG